MSCCRWDESLEESSYTSFSGNDRRSVQEASHSRVRRLPVVNPVNSYQFNAHGQKERMAYSVVLMLSKGVTASNDSVMPAPKPAMTVLGPDIWPDSSCNRVLYVSKATKPRNPSASSSFNSTPGKPTYSSLQRVANDQSRTSRIPSLPERRPAKLLSIR